MKATGANNARAAQIVTACGHSRLARLPVIQTMARWAEESSVLVNRYDVTEPAIAESAIPTRIILLPTTPRR